MRLTSECSMLDGSVGSSVSLISTSTHSRRYRSIAVSDWSKQMRSHTIDRAREDGDIRRSNRSFLPTSSLGLVHGAGVGATLGSMTAESAHI